MSDERIQRTNQFPFSKSIVGKVGLIMAMMTLCAMLLSVSTYVMHDSASTDTNNTSRLEIPSALLSVSMLRYAGEMNRSMLSYALGQSPALENYYRNKNQFEVSLNELIKLHGKDTSNLKSIESIYDNFIDKIENEVIEEYDPKRELWALNEKRIISATLAPELFDSISLLDSSKDTSDLLSMQDTQHHIWLIRDEVDDMISALFFYLSGEENQKDRFDANEAFFRNHINYLRKNSTDSTIIEQLDLIERLGKTLTDRMTRVFNQYEPSKKLDAVSSLKAINVNEYKALETSLTEFSRQTSFSAANSMANLRNVLKNNQLSFFALFGIMSIVSIFVTYYIYKKVTQPIARLADTMRNLADGNTEIPILYKDRPDEVGQISHALSSFRDHIISRNQAREQLLYQKELAETASKAKAQFLAAMSHEIRTPMNGVIGMIDILLRSKLDTSQMSVANTVRESALSLLAIINDILDFSRIEAGKMRIDNVTISLRHIAEQVMDNLATEAAEKNVSLTLFVSPEVPTSLLGDPTRIKQILFNIIGNGIKFSGGQPHRGEVQVWITSEPTTEGAAKILIEIRDNGIGISKDKLEAIFQPFTQAEYSTTRRYGGSGLGLAISRNIASLMGGAIAASSEEGIGSTFMVSFSLPYSQEVTAPDECNIGLLRESAASLDNVICINSLENGALKVSIDNYLQSMNIPVQSITIEMLHLQRFEREDVKYVVLCRDYLKTKQLMPAFVPPNVDIRYLEFDMNLPVHRYGGMDVFAIFSSPLKLASLLSGLRICVGLESPDYPVIDTRGKEAFIERTEETQGTILVAEDNATNQTVIEKQLTYLGYHVVMTSDGLEALRAYRNKAFTLVLTDCHMPNMDGYELTKAIREIQKERAEFVPIVALTANALVGEAERCIETGMNDFIAKPVEIDVIQKVLSKWCAQSKPFEAPKDEYQKTMSESSASKTAAEQEALTSLHDIKVELDPEVLKKLFWGDTETYAEVLGEFIKHCEPELNVLSDFRAPYNYAEIKMLSHKLKTSSRSIGAIELSDLCMQIEKSATSENPDTERLLDDLRPVLSATLLTVHHKHADLLQSLGERAAEN
ncbi:ATP-binding protein [Grimontia marina]|uniref:Sensory/regulatory protein RpfC n=1 Tax=Grimontia marina TaxID=646534 RepID=A0A128FI03_9GAMM|nr:ATP-binding protein [Grimontia marina]CZF86125.1 Signal transduction histidine-protein kinase BarA [Grimontia marina]